MLRLQIEAGVTRKGDLTNLRGTATVLYGDQKMEANLLHKWNSRKARLVASLSTPYTEDIKVNLEKTGDLQADASISYGRAYSVDASGSASHNTRETTLSTSVKYRLGGPRRLLAASLAKTGSLEDLALTASASLDKQEISLTAELNTLRDIKAAVALRTPFNDFESLGASFHNSGDLSGMTTEANVEYMTDKNINGKMELAFRGLEQLSFRGSLTLPMAGFERSVLSLSHVLGPKMCSGSFNVDSTVADFGTLDASYQNTGKLNNMKGEARVTYNSRSLLDANMAYRLTPSRLQSSLRVLTPALPELNVEVNHQGDASRFSTKASASAGTSKLSTDTQWSMSEDNMDLSQSFFTHLQGYSNQAGIVFSKVGPFSDVTMQLSGNINAVKAKIVGKLATVRDLTASLEMDTPFDGYRQLGASFRKTGEPSDLSITATANKEQQKMEIAGKFNNENDVRGSVDVMTPFNGYSQMGASFSYGGENAMLSANLLNDRILATGRFVNDDVMEGSVDIKTPFNGYDKMGAAFSLGAEKAMVSGNLQNDKIEATGKFVNDDAMEGTVEVKTPFTGYNQMGASFNYGSNSMTAAANLENDKIEATAKFDNTDGMTGALDISTPFTGYTQLGGQIRYAGDLSDLTVTATGNVERSKVEATVKFNNVQDMSGSVDIATPFQGYRRMGSSFALNGDLSDLTFTSEGFVQREKMEVKAKFDQKSGSVEVNTPFSGYRQMGASFQQRGDTDDLSLQLAANLMNEKMEALVAFANKDSLSGSVNIVTPFEGFHEVGASFKHSGKMDNFNCEGMITYMDNQHISGEVSGAVHVYNSLTVMADY